jgi:hypothetical protein
VGCEVSAIITHKSGSRTIKDRTLVVAWANDANCVWQDGGDLVLKRVHVKGGNGVHAEAGKLQWSDSQSVGKFKKYGLWGGNVLLGRMLELHLYNVDFNHHSDNEAICRLMGVRGVITGCTFDQSKSPKNKEAVQTRYSKGDGIIFSGCSFIGGATTGPLDNKTTDSLANMNKYMDWAWNNPLRVAYDNCSFAGAAPVSGNSIVEFNQCNFRKDPRGISGSTAITTRSWTWNGRFYAPKVVARGCTFTGFSKLAGSGVKVE